MTPPHYTFAILLTVLIASVGMFVANVWRSVHKREWLELKEWTRRNGMRVRQQQQGGSLPLPAVLKDLLPGATVTSLIHDADDRHVFVSAGWRNDHWHLLILSTPARWSSPAGLRPVLPGTGQLVKLLPLLEYPSLPGSERFITHAAALRPARVLAESHARALLPPDVGLLLKDGYLILDFSSRPFDPLEFSRLLPLGDQLVAHLPASP
jgi:hypothetical protein